MSVKLTLRVCVCVLNSMREICKSFFVLYLKRVREIVVYGNDGCVCDFLIDEKIKFSIMNDVNREVY